MVSASSAGPDVKGSRLSLSIMERRDSSSQRHCREGWRDLPSGWRAYCCASLVMGRRLGCLLLAVLGALSIACNEEGTISVHSLSFKGVKHIEESTLKTALATHASSKLP